MSDKFLMNKFVIPDTLEECIEQIWNELGEWRRYIIAVDGKPSAGKSVAGRYISYRLNMPVIESDLFLIADGKFHYTNSLNDIVTTRLNLKRPLLFEGVFAAQTLSKLGLKPDFLVRVVATNCINDDQTSEYVAYEVEFTPNFVVEFRNPFHD